MESDKSKNWIQVKDKEIQSLKQNNVTLSKSRETARGKWVYSTGLKLQTEEL